MNSYKQIRSPISQNTVVGIYRIVDMGSIPFDPANTDYQRFKSDIAAGAELQDADGNPMTTGEAQVFVAALP